MLQGKNTQPGGFLSRWMCHRCIGFCRGKCKGHRQEEQPTAANRSCEHGPAPQTAAEPAGWCVAPGVPSGTRVPRSSPQRCLQPNPHLPDYLPSQQYQSGRIPICVFRHELEALSGTGAPRMHGWSVGISRSHCKHLQSQRFGSHSFKTSGSSHFTSVPFGSVATAQVLSSRSALSSSPNFPLPSPVEFWCFQLVICLTQRLPPACLLSTRRKKGV